MKLIDLIQELDGAGLVITDQWEVETHLGHMGLIDATITPAEFFSFLSNRVEPILGDADYQTKEDLINRISDLQ
jgi:hypothetical protein